MLRDLILLTALLAAVPSAYAQAPTEAVDPLALEVHAFVSQGFLLTTRNNYLDDTKDGSFEFTEVGINFTKPLTDDLRAGLQLFARDLGPVGNYEAKFDWFYLDYRFRDWLGFRAGRTKLPFGLYNEVNDIDAAHGVVFLPQSVYPTQNRDFLLALTGAEVYGYLRLGGAGALDYRLYGGTVFIDVEPVPGSPYEIRDLGIPYLAGGRLLWETPLDGLRLGGSAQVLRLEADLLFDRETWEPLQMMGMLPNTFRGEVEADIPAVLWVGSIEYVANDLQLAAEYGRWHVKSESSEPLLFPTPTGTVSSERAYVLVAYRFLPWLRPSLYYALLFPDVDQRKGRQWQRHDVAGTVRFDINAYWIVKVEAHFLSGTAELRPALNDGTPIAELKRNWGLFAIKTTAYF